LDVDISGQALTASDLQQTHSVVASHPASQCHQEWRATGVIRRKNFRLAFRPRLIDGLGFLFRIAPPRLGKGD